jgi:hypothetical protein
MYNFEEIKEVIMPYLEGLYDPMFTMYPYNAEHKILYNKDEVFIVAHENMRLLECLGLNKEHQDQITMLSYNICSRNMNAMFEELENSDEYKRELELHNEELQQYLADMEELQAQEAAEFEDSVRYYDVIGDDYEALYGCLRSSLIRHTEELLTLVDHTADTIACELQVSVQDVERIMSRLKDKIKETTNL